MSADKTNVMRSLDQKKIKYKVHEYKESGAVSGVEVAAALGQDPKRAFKTLVTIGKSGNHYVFMVPVAEELDLKKAAKCVGEKNIEMIKSKELLPLTGYIHGGCSPVGMKKFFRTVIDKSVLDIEDTIPYIFSFSLQNQLLFSNLLIKLFYHPKRLLTATILLSIIIKLLFIPFSKISCKTEKNVPWHILQTVDKLGVGCYIQPFFF